MAQIGKHILAWMVVSILLFVLLASFAGFALAGIKTLTLMLGMITAFYLNTCWLLPAFYARKKTGLFLLFSFLLLVVLALTCMFLTDLLLNYAKTEVPVRPGGFIGPPKPPPHRPPGPGPHLNFRYWRTFEIFLNHAMPVVFGIFAGLTYFTIRQRSLEEQKKAENKSAENAFLISQINPHFLFNALNNIYALTLGDTKTGNAILQLSEILSYSIYKGQHERVRLEEEINYIGNYIKIYKLRDDELDNIDFSWHNADPNFKIAPLLILPFVENAFKHGNVEEGEGAWVKLKVETKGKTLFMTCENTLGKHPKDKDQVGGIGIQNIKRRLELNYKGKYDLTIEKGQELYRVNLKLEGNGS